MYRFAVAELFCIKKTPWTAYVQGRRLSYSQKDQSMSAHIAKISCSGPPLHAGVATARRPAFNLIRQGVQAIPYSIAPIRLPFAFPLKRRAITRISRSTTGRGIATQRVSKPACRLFLNWIRRRVCLIFTWRSLSLFPITHEIFRPAVLKSVFRSILVCFVRFVVQHRSGFGPPIRVNQGESRLIKGCASEAGWNAGESPARRVGLFTTDIDLDSVAGRRGWKPGKMYRQAFTKVNHS